MRTKTIARLAGLLAVAALALGLAACGSSSSSSSKPGNPTDLAFVSAMIPHHESAIDMAKVAQRRGESAFVKKLADDIVTAQDSEITTMKAEMKKLTSAGVKKGDLGMSASMAGMSGDMKSLEKAKPFDREFIDMMVPHHQGAIRMARREISMGKNAKLTKLAEAVVGAQSREIKAMNAYRKKTFGAPSPAGGVPPKGSMKMDGGSSMEGM